MKKNKNFCYRCHREATSKEHIPAKGFFPEDNRINLMTVPSCDEHNTKKSDADEYSRNLFTISASINETGLNHGFDKTIRSLQRNRSLFTSLFHDSNDTILKGEKTKEVIIDKSILTKYFEGLAYGLYRFINDKNYSGYWYIHIDFDKPLDSGNSSLDDDQKRVALALRKISFPEFIGENPEIFKYTYVKINNMFVFKLVFYEGHPVFFGEKKIFFPHIDEKYIED